MSTVDEIKYDGVMRGKRDHGQVALIIVLAVTVAGTLAVSLASRTTTGLRTGGRDTEGVQALKGAESGVEEALYSEGAVEGNVGEVSYSASYDEVGEGGFVSAGLVEAGDVIEIEVEGSASKPTGLRIYFSSQEGAALKVARYDSDGSSYGVDYVTVESDADRRADNSFEELADATGYDFGGVNFANRFDVDSETETFFFRVMVLYAPSFIGVEPLGGNLPDQQVVVAGTGAVDETNIVRKVELKKEKERVPAVFDRVLYSNSAVVQ